MKEIIFSLAGLGLFLSGLNLLSSSIKIFTGKGFHKLITSVTNSTVMKGAVGSLIGLITQSTNAGTFLIIGLVQANLIPLKTALILIAWIGVGTSFLVFVASIDIQFLGYILLSIVSIFYLFNLKNNENLFNVSPLIFAIGLIFLGLGIIKLGTNNMQSFFWINEFFVFASETIVISIILGLFFTLISQSASVITILVITLVSSQVIPMDSAIFMIIGSNIGSGLSLLLFHPHLEGQQKKIILFQLSTKILGSFFILVIILITPHIFFDFTLYKNINFLTIQLSLLYLYLQLTGALIATILNGKINALLNYLIPDQEIDLISKPKFIYQEILNDEGIAINLINQEQQRLLNFLPKYMDYVRHDNKSDLLLQERHKGYSLLYLAIKDFTDQVISNNPQKGMAELLILQSKNESIKSLMNSLKSFASIAKENNLKKSDLSISMAESLHMLLTLLRECEKSQEDIGILINLTAEQGSLMDEIRTKVSKSNGTSGHEQKALFLLTRLFERLVWQIRKHNSIQ